jgi:hypothetical protein
MTGRRYLGREAVKNESAGEEWALHEVEKREGGAAREQDHGGAAQAGPHSLQQNRVKETSHEKNESAGEERALHKVEKREGGAAREQVHGGAAQAGPHSLHQNRVNGTSHEMDIFFLKFII